MIVVHQMCYLAPASARTKHGEAGGIEGERRERGRGGAAHVLKYN